MSANTKWVTDITYIRTAEAWLYLCVVVDLYNKAVVGWSMSARQTRDLALIGVRSCIVRGGNDIGFRKCSEHGIRMTVELVE